MNKFTDPTLASGRSLGPDLARGCMLLLIAMAYTDAHLSDWGVHASEVARDSMADQIAVVVKTLFRDNRAYPMFAFLFGYGSMLLVRKLESGGQNRKQILQTLRLRGLGLLIIGFIHSVFVFNYEILAPYGAALLVTAPLLFSTDQKLKKLLLILIPVFLILMTGIGFMYALPPEAYGDESYGMTQADTYIQMLQNSLVNFPLSVLMVLGYPIVPVMLLGMLAARMQLTTTRSEQLAGLGKTACWGISISVTGGLPLLLKELHWWQPSYEAEALSTSLQLISGTFGGIGYAACFGIIALNIQSSGSSPVQAIAALGKRSLTGYLLQSMLIMLIMSPYFGNLGSKLSYYQSALLGLTVWSINVCLCYLLDYKNIPGPMDTLLRKFTYRFNSYPVNKQNNTLHHG